jgi:twitching motility protein PilT
MAKTVLYSIKNSQPMSPNIQEVDEFLRLVVDKGASDLHLKVPSPPVLRIDGELIPEEDLPPLTAMDIEVAFEQVTNQGQRAAFRRDRELDFAYSLPGVGRFRVNALQQRGTMSLAFRLVRFGIPSIDELRLPQICRELIVKPRGLILVTGPAGSGKSTTLAAMISHLNETRRKNIITIEDPIEYLFQDRKCIIRQRDLGDDTESFHTALIHALRHDPDIIVIGEMRDLDTVSTAMRAAETGHLVLGTLHTVDAAQSIDRIIDMFPYGQQRQIRLQLSQVIEAVLSQALLPRIEGGRIAAFEIMIATGVIRRLIREEKIFDIRPNMEMGIREGMQTLDQALADLVKSGEVVQEEAMMRSSNTAQLNRWLQQQNHGEPFKV